MKNIQRKDKRYGTGIHRYREFLVGHIQPIFHFISIHLATVEPDIFAKRKLLPISPPGLVGELFVQQIFWAVVILSW